MAAAKKPNTVPATEDPNHTRVKNIRGADKNTLPVTGQTVRETTYENSTVRRDY